jgi:beta-xylosidase
MKIFPLFNRAVLALFWCELAFSQNSSYTNPILPGWHSDPSSIYVGENYNAYFCVTSTFLAFPGVPLYAGRDVMNWRLASNILSETSQVPWLGNATAQQAGIWAATLRYHQGTFYVATVFTYQDPWVLHGVIFTTTNPYNAAAWGKPLIYNATEIDPDLFWDDDGQLYH